MLHEKPGTRPWIVLDTEEHTLVSIPSNVRDFWWQTIDSPRADADYVNGIADEILTADGSGGKVREVLDAGGWPVLLTHWQSLFSNGTEAGLAVLDEVGRRVARSLKSEVEGMPCLEIARRRADSLRAASGSLWAATAAPSSRSNCRS